MNHPANELAKVKATKKDVSEGKSWGKKQHGERLKVGSVLERNIGPFLGEDLQRLETTLTSFKRRDLVVQVSDLKHVPKHVLGDLPTL